MVCSGSILRTKRLGNRPLRSLILSFLVRVIFGDIS